MILIKRCDVKNHLFARRHAHRNAIRLVPAPAKAALPVPTPVPVDANDTAFAVDFSLEQCSPGGTVTAVVIATPEDLQVTELPRVPQP